MIEHALVYVRFISLASCSFLNLVGLAKSTDSTRTRGVTRHIVRQWMVRLN